ncbi:hypothetical protein BHE90_010059 [Fusarium euwallaceae]|uniref:Uncharacterized protein n=1 Tax=Fusarium euwallaceae TaxID=1147111 RepID=A0A430LIK8_9HYPO|nr:hypothetical protein BHE90_010059 [Fusarium euwallaceae]
MTVPDGTGSLDEGDIAANPKWTVDTVFGEQAFCVFEELRCALFLACSLSLFFSRDSYAMHDRSVDAADAPGSRPSAASMMLGPATDA